MDESNIRNGEDGNGDSAEIAFVDHIATCLYCTLKSFHCCCQFCMWLIYVERRIFKCHRNSFTKWKKKKVAETHETYAFPRMCELSDVHIFVKLRSIMHLTQILSQIIYSPQYQYIQLLLSSIVFHIFRFAIYLLHYCIKPYGSRMQCRLTKWWIACLCQDGKNIISSHFA